MYKVTYQNHDQGAKGGFMVRKSIEDAERSAKLMRECGYQTIIEKI